MTPFPKISRLMAWLSAILVAGFLAVASVGYLVASSTVQQLFSQLLLPMVSDFADAAIARLIERSAMGDDYFRRWLKEGERDRRDIAHYLKDVVEHSQGLAGSYLASARTRMQYLSSGAQRLLEEGNPGDAWFFRIQDAAGDAPRGEASVEGEKLWLGRRLVDERGGFAGVAGVALPLGPLVDLIEEYRNRFACRIYFVDASGIVVLGGRAIEHLRDRPELRQIADQILYSSIRPRQTAYEDGGERVLVNSRLLPRLGWVMVVERSTWEGVGPLRHALLFNLLVALLATALVLGAVLFAFRRHAARIGSAAAVDLLTGLINRHAYEFIFRQTLLETARGREPLSIIRFELDGGERLLKAVGKVGRDDVLRQIAELARTTVRDSDPACRWDAGGFLVQLRDCPLANAREVAERLRLKVAGHDFGLGDVSRVFVSVSCGVATHIHPGSGVDLPERAALALVRARKAGGNRVEPEAFSSDENLERRPRRQALVELGDEK